MKQGFEITRDLIRGTWGKPLFRGHSCRLDGLDTFCFFVGNDEHQGRLICQLLNHHPQILISGGSNSFRLLEKGLTEHQLYDLICRTRYGRRKSGSLRVIGDRRAGASAREIFSRPRSVDSVAEKITLAKKFLHAYRNPFDAIASSSLKGARPGGSVTRPRLEQEVRQYFERCTGVKLVHTNFGAQQLFLMNHDRLVADPVRTLTDLCTFFAVDCPESFLDEGRQAIRESDRKTRYAVPWDADLKALVRSRIREFFWLEPYQQEDF
ncbi:MAG: sulfotransferase [bacterium]